MRDRINLHFQPPNLTDNEFEELLKCLSEELLKEPFIKSTSSFKKHFPGFRINSVKVDKIKHAIIKEFRLANSKIIDYILTEYIMLLIQEEEIDNINLVKKVLNNNNELVDKIIKYVEEEQGNIREKIKERQINQKDKSEDIKMKIKGKNVKIDEINANQKKYENDMAVKVEEIKERITDVDKLLKVQENIIIKAKNEIDTLKKKEKESLVSC